MSDSDTSLRDALQDVKEAYLLSVAKRLISGKILDHEVIVLARTLPAAQVIKKLKRAYVGSYLWNKLKRHVA